MLETSLQVLKDNEAAISAAVGLLTLCAAVWGALRLTFPGPRKQPGTAPPPRRPRRSRGARRWAALMNLGVDRHSRLEELVSVRTVNVAFLCVGGISLPWLVVSLTSTDTALLTGITLFVFVGVLAGFALQWSGHTGVARWLLVTIVNIYWLGIMLAVGAMSGTEYYLAGLLILPVLIFSRAERSQTLLAMLTTIVCFALGIALTRMTPPALVLPETMWLIGYHVNALLLAMMLFVAVSYYRWFAASSYRELEARKKQNDALVSNLFPSRIAERIGENSGTVAEWHPEATVLYASLTGFTQLYNRMSAVELVNRLALIYASFDRLVHRHGIDKIKTLGTTYVAATGIGGGPAEHSAVASCALAMRDALNRFAAENALPLSFHCGVASGLAISGVITGTRPRYDVCGEALEIAARMREAAAGNTICVNELAFWRLRDDFELDTCEQTPQVYRLIAARESLEQPARLS
jgi:adenylate cyclase